MTEQQDQVRDDLFSMVGLAERLYQTEMRNEQLERAIATQVRRFIAQVHRNAADADMES